MYEAWCNKMPADLSGHIGLGICLLSLSRAEECVRRMEAVRATLPEHELLLGLLARAYAALKNADALLDAWQRWNACVSDRATAEFFAQTVHMWGLLGGELSASQGADPMLQRLITSQTLRWPQMLCQRCVMRCSIFMNMTGRSFCSGWLTFVGSAGCAASMGSDARLQLSWC